MKTIPIPTPEQREDRERTLAAKRSIRRKSDPTSNENPALLRLLGATLVPEGRATWEALVPERYRRHLPGLDDDLP